MIALLTGTLALREPEAVVLDVNGVGYEVFVSSRTLDALPAIDGPLRLHIVTVVREDAFLLYGFGSRAEKALFLALTAVTGVGPKLALSALGAMEPADLRRAIMRGDTTTLSRISGVGKKTAQRLVLELADKVAAIDLGDATPSTASMPLASGPAQVASDIHSAMVNLGYPEKRVEALLRDLEPRIQAGESMETLLRAALRLIGSPSGS